jgi:hypothetical protein
LKYENIRKKYADSIDIQLNDRRAGNIEMEWNKISLVIKEIGWWSTKWK